MGDAPYATGDEKLGHYFGPHHKSKCPIGGGVCQLHPAEPMQLLPPASTGDDGRALYQAEADHSCVAMLLRRFSAGSNG